MLCNSIMQQQKMCADKTNKYDPTKSVLKYKSGDKIKLSESDFARVFPTFFAEIEKKYL